MSNVQYGELSQQLSVANHSLLNDIPYFFKFFLVLSWHWVVDDDNDDDYIS